MSDDFLTIMLIMALGLATYLTRIGGHLVLSRFERIDPRLEAALDAVPTAVMTAIVAPMALASGVAEAVATMVTVAVSMRLPILWALVAGAGTVVILRGLGL